MLVQAAPEDIEHGMQAVTFARERIGNRGLQHPELNLPLDWIRDIPNRVQQRPRALYPLLLSVDNHA